MKRKENINATEIQRQIDMTDLSFKMYTRKKIKNKPKMARFLKCKPLFAFNQILMGSQFYNEISKFGWFKKLDKIQKKTWNG